jgi:hypothetical protein
MRSESRTFYRRAWCHQDKRTVCQLRDIGLDPLSKVSHEPKCRGGDKPWRLNAWRNSNADIVNLDIQCRVGGSRTNGLRESLFPASSLSEQAECSFQRPPMYIRPWLRRRQRSYADERRRDQGCGDQEKGKEAMAARPRCGRRRLGEAARQTVPLLKIIFPWHCIPMRRRVLDRLAVFTDPSTGLRQAMP